MNNLKHFKFINTETGNVISYLSLPQDSLEMGKELENARLKIAAENGLFVANVFFVADDEDETDGGPV